jgi:hypothetical protein
MLNDDDFAFYISKEELKKANAWQDAHDKEKHMRSDHPLHSAVRYTGAIGGAYTWCFTPTSIGVVCKLKCSCGEELDFTDYDSW